MHLFYRHRIVDVADKLTKYLDGWDGPEYEAPGAERSGKLALLTRKTILVSMLS